MPTNPIQLITALAEIQDRRRALDQQQAQFDQSKTQFAQQMGFNEKDQKAKLMGQLLDRIGAASSDSRSALEQLGSVFGFNPQEQQALVQYGQNAPQTLQMIQAQSANRGAQAMQGTPMQAQVDQSAAMGAMAGQSPGQFSADRLGQAITDTLRSSPGLVDLMAKQKAGQTLSAQEQAQYQVGMGQVAANFYGSNAQLLGQMGAAQGRGGPTAETQMQAYTQMRELTKQMSAAKGDTEVTTLLAQYNNLAHQYAPQLIIPSKDAAPHAAGLLDHMIYSIMPWRNFPGIPAAGAAAYGPPLPQQGPTAASTPNILQYLQSMPQVPPFRPQP